jgi:hypothetical protein
LHLNLPEISGFKGKEVWKQQHDFAGVILAGRSMQAIFAFLRHGVS